MPVVGAQACQRTQQAMTRISHHQCVKPCLFKGTHLITPTQKETCAPHPTNANIHHPPHTAHTSNLPGVLDSTHKPSSPSLQPAHPCTHPQVLKPRHPRTLRTALRHSKPLCRKLSQTTAAVTSQGTGGGHRCSTKRGAAPAERRVC